MKLTLNLEFSVPIWRFFYGDVDPSRLPYEFMLNDKIYTNGITIIQFAWDVEVIVGQLRKDLHLYQNPILCAPSIEALNILKNNFKCPIVLASHNAFIDETIYNINPLEKKYDMIINSCFEKYKRRHLANLIQNIIHIGYYQSTNNNEMYTPKTGFCPNFMKEERNIKNYKHIDIDDCVKYYNSSKVGGIFSQVEGACFSSGEYLLCGLPVVSTYCSGGREHWYNEENSILCNPTEIDVKNAFDKAINNLKTGKFNPQKIRQLHLDEMENHRNNLTYAVINLFKKITLDVPTFNELKNSLKHYHSNINAGSKYGIKQQIEEMQALKVYKK